MTISVTDAATGPYFPNGATVAFPFDFSVEDRSEVRVFLISSDGSEETISPALYDVQPAANRDGGTVIMSIAPPADGRPLWIASDPSFEQEILFEDEGPFNSAVLNPMADRAARKSIWLRDRVGRAVTVPFGDPAVTMQSIGARANRLLMSTSSGALVGGPTIDQINGAIANALAAQSNQGLASAVIYNPAGLGATFRSVETRLRERWISVKDYGAACDAVLVDVRTVIGTDDTLAIQRAIAAAAATGVKTIVFPGLCRANSPIINNTWMPSGLEFVGMRPGFEGSPKSGIVFDGLGTMFDINHAGRMSNEGRWTFRQLFFHRTKPSATSFDFNRANEGRLIKDYYPEDPAPDTYSALEYIRFEACLFTGPDYQSPVQTGDAIRGAKCFQMLVDDATFIRDARRGVFLYGCDNCTISPRAFLCAREIMIQASGTFGNDNRIASRFLGGSPVNGSAEVDGMFNVWDTGNSTVIEHRLDEDNSQNRAGFYYLNGFSTLILSPHFGGGKSFRLGPSGRDIVMFRPTLTAAPIGTDAPIIDNPTSWDFNEQNNARITIIGASINVQNMLGTHPRLDYVASDLAGGLKSSRPAAEPVSPFLSGLAPRQLVARCVSSQLPLRVAGGAVFEQVAGAPSGWGVALPVNGTGQVFADARVGRDLARTKYRVIFLRRQFDTKTYAPQLFVNNAQVAVLGGLPTDGVWRVHEMALDLSAAADGQLVRFLYAATQGASDGTAHLGFVVFEPVNGAIGDVAYDPPLIAAGQAAAVDVPARGATLGMFASASFSSALGGLIISAHVKASDVIDISTGTQVITTPGIVTVTLFNPTAAAIDLPAGRMKVGARWNV